MDASIWPPASLPYRADTALWSKSSPTLVSISNAIRTGPHLLNHLWFSKNNYGTSKSTWVTLHLRSFCPSSLQTHSHNRTVQSLFFDSKQAPSLQCSTDKNLKTHVHIYFWKNLIVQYVTSKSIRGLRNKNTEVLRSMLWVFLWGDRIYLRRKCQGDIWNYLICGGRRPTERTFCLLLGSAGWVGCQIHNAHASDSANSPRGPVSLAQGLLPSSATNREFSIRSLLGRGAHGDSQKAGLLKTPRWPKGQIGWAKRDTIEH
jgi:hypothetical protein